MAVMDLSSEGLKSDATTTHGFGSGAVRTTRWPVAKSLALLLGGSAILWALIIVGILLVI